MNELTEKQRKVLEFIKSYSQAHGYPPTFREIGSHFGFLWSAARTHLKAIEKKGHLRVVPSRSRGIEIKGYPQSEGILLPVAGRIRAGHPILAFEEIESHIFVDRTLFPAEDAFSLRVTGDSMRDAGIFDGDYVVVRPQTTLKNGEIGIVLLGDEATVKRVFMDKGLITLRPENNTMKPLTCKADEVEIIGKVMGVVRKI